MPNYTGTLYNGNIISIKSIDPLDASNMFSDYIEGYIENPIKENGIYRSKSENEIKIEIDNENKNKSLSKSIFTRSEIRTAMKSLNIEDLLNTLLSSNTDFQIYWNENTSGIDLNNTLTKAALVNFTDEQIENIKLQIAGII